MNPPVAARPLDILVIEDDVDASANLCDILALDDHRVTAVGYAADALKEIGARPFAAIILDRRLPDATAEQLMPRIKELAPDSAVIVVTGYADLQGAIAALREGATDYILKPYNPDALRASLGRISERKQLTLAKERSEAAFRLLVEAADCMIVIVRPDHTIAYFSPFAERLTGFTANEARGRNYLALLLPERGWRSIAEQFLRVLAGHPIEGIQSSVVCRDGSQRWIVWNARCLPDYQDNPAILIVGHDITFLKQAQERALQAERLAAIGQMVAGLAHESRNALQRSQACLEMLALAVRDRPEALDLIGRLQKAQDDLHHLYEDVRGYAAPVKLETTECDLTTIWRDAWAHLEPARKHKEAVLREVASGACTRCLADPFRLEQVFHNILENALAACPSPIVIEIGAVETELGGAPAIRVSIRDNGPGIAPKQRSKVFDPFYTTKSKGTGLGMAIAGRIIEAHGGQIEIGDDDGPGACFLITLLRGLP
jgi:PAS domain S-box-containing protein